MTYRVLGADGKEYGPVPAEQVRLWVSEGRVHANSLVRPGEADEWRPISTLPDFRAAFGARPPTMAVSLRGRPIKQVNSCAVTGLILGVVSVTLCSCCCVGIPLDVLGVVFSIIGLVQISNNPDTQEGTGLAVTGLVLSLISLCSGLLFGCLVLLGNASGANWEFQFLGPARELLSLKSSVL